MKNLLKHKSGFTMIELMVVVIIVAILAAAAIPLYTANVKRAIRTEADATLGAIRSAEKIYKAEFGTYTGADNSAGATGVNAILGVDVTAAHYFDSLAYSVDGASLTAFTAKCTVDNATTAAPGSTTAKKYWGAGTIFTMNEFGVTAP